MLAIVIIPHNCHHFLEIKTSFLFIVIQIQTVLASLLRI